VCWAPQQVGTKAVCSVENSACKWVSNLDLWTDALMDAQRVVLMDECWASASAECWDDLTDTYLGLHLVESTGCWRAALTADW
jgi:hypothetical protein